MLLAIDIGNTNITLGIWDQSEWRLQWRLRSVPDKTADEYGIDLRTLLREFELTGKIERVIMSSVVPSLTSTFMQMSERYLGQACQRVNCDMDLPIRIETDNPHEVGADRIVNAVAAYHLYPGPSLVIDMGTGTTIDVVSGDGALLGVVIAPGMKVAADALTQRAAQLQGVGLEAPPNVIGRNTVHAVQSGIVFGYTGLIEGLVQRLKNELKEPNLLVIGTGGLIQLIAPNTEIIDQIDPWLTLTGLRLIDEYKQGK